MSMPLSVQHERAPQRRPLSVVANFMPNAGGDFSCRDEAVSQHVGRETNDFHRRSRASGGTRHLAWDSRTGFVRKRCHHPRYGEIPRYASSSRRRGSNQFPDQGIDSRDRFNRHPSSGTPEGFHVAGCGHRRLGTGGRAGESPNRLSGCVPQVGRNAAGLALRRSARKLPETPAPPECQKFQNLRATPRHALGNESHPRRTGIPVHEDGKRTQDDETNTRCASGFSIGASVGPEP
jgi:hypothetical protein